MHYTIKSRVCCTWKSQATLMPWHQQSFNSWGHSILFLPNSIISIKYKLYLIKWTLRVDWNLPNRKGSHQKKFLQEHSFRFISLEVPISPRNHIESHQSAMEKPYNCDKASLECQNYAMGGNNNLSTQCIWKPSYVSDFFPNPICSLQPQVSVEIFSSRIWFVVFTALLF